MELVIGGLLILALIALILLGVPVAFCLLAVGFVGYGFVAGWGPALGFLNIKVFDCLHSFTLMCVPLFILLGFIAAEAGFVTDAYTTVKKWFSRLPGGLGVTTTGACALFGAVSGSSVAMAATMGVIAYPEMRKANYHPGFAASTIAIGGTIGILIPPSIPMILYGIILDQPINVLFIAGLLPGILLSFFLATAIIGQVKLNPGLAPTVVEVYSLKEKLISLKGLLPILILFLIVMGGLYTGVFTASEAAAFGAFAALFLGLGLRRLNREAIMRILRDMVPMCGMLFLVIMGAIIMSDFMIVSGLGAALADFVGGLLVPNWVILVAIAGVFLFFGMLMDIIGLFMICLPIFAPIVTVLGFSPIWFGVFATILAEACMITPPVGLNVYVLAGTAPDAALEDIFKRVLVFLPVILLVLALIVIFPQIALWLPGTMR